MSFFLKLKKKKVACHQTLLVYLPSLCAVLLPLFSNCFIKKKNKGKYKWQTDCGVALQTWHDSERGWLCTGLPAWTINQGDSMCTVLMRSHTMQIVTSTENKGWEQHVFVLPGTICLHLNSPHVTYKKQSNQGTQQRPLKIQSGAHQTEQPLCVVQVLRAVPVPWVQESPQPLLQPGPAHVDQGSGSGVHMVLMAAFIHSGSLIKLIIN